MPLQRLLNARARVCVCVHHDRFLSFNDACCKMGSPCCAASMALCACSLRSLARTAITAGLFSTGRSAAACAFTSRSLRFFGAGSGGGAVISPGAGDSAALHITGDKAGDAAAVAGVRGAGDGRLGSDNVDRRALGRTAATCSAIAGEPFRGGKLWSEERRFTCTWLSSRLPSMLSLDAEDTVAVLNLRGGGDGGDDDNDASDDRAVLNESASSSVEELLIIVVANAVAPGEGNRSESHRAFFARRPPRRVVIIAGRRRRCLRALEPPRVGEGRKKSA